MTLAELKKRLSSLAKQVGELAAKHPDWTAEQNICMAEPLVCAVILTRDHPEMAARAVQCFREQTYWRKTLVVVSNGAAPFPETIAKKYWWPEYEGRSIGNLRNMANSRAVEDHAPDILVHFDDDDWSHPNRIAEQVALLQSSGAECVGYHSMYFWQAPILDLHDQISEAYNAGNSLDVTNLTTHEGRLHGYGRVYLYAGEPPYALGTSLCYWRSVWEKRPFEDVPMGEDSKFLDGTNAEGKRIHEPLRVASVSANVVPRVDAPSGIYRYTIETSEPRMVARIHPDSLSYKAGYRRRLDAEPWSRVTDPAVIEYCRKAMEL